MLFHFESRRHPVIGRAAFVRRMSHSALAGSVLVLVSLAIGMLGYYAFEHLGWLDSFLNASMILSGMGPLWSPQTVAGKLFAGFYALYSGITVLVFAAITFAPLFHRMLHAFHADDSDEPGERPTSARKKR